MKLKNNGFTLIELLVVIAIIGALSGIVLFGTRGVFETSRDTQRKADIDQYRVALEAYANNHDGLFPEGLDTNIVSVCTNDLGLTVCPDDPKYETDPSAVWEHYGYHSNTSGSSYVAFAKLEDQNNGVYWVVCSDGQSAQHSTGNNGTDGDCPI